jgi:hypothetical protein
MQIDAPKTVEFGIINLIQQNNERLVEPHGRGTPNRDDELADRESANRHMVIAPNFSFPIKVSTVSSSQTGTPQSR